MKKFKRYLFENNIKQCDFSKLIGVTNSTVNQYANGNVVPSTKTIFKIEQLTNGEIKPSDWFESIKESNK